MVRETMLDNYFRDHMYGTNGGGKWGRSLGRLYKGGEGGMTSYADVQSRLELLNE